MARLPVLRLTLDGEILAHIVMRAALAEIASGSSAPRRLARNALAWAARYEVEDVADA